MAMVHLLDVDPDLGEHLDFESRERARDLLRLRVVEVPRGVWRPPGLEPGATGLLMLSGLAARRLKLGTVSSTELIGPSDILRPWEEDLIPSVRPPQADWRALQDLSLAVIDGQATAVIGRFPPLSAAITARLLRRARALSYLMAAQHFLRVEDRLLATLWHLATMWGRVTPHGTVVPFRLTHDTLASIIGAQRPTTTTAIRSLTVQGRLRRDEQRNYLLLGDPPDWEDPRLEAMPVEA